MQIVITIDDKDYNDIITDSPRNLNHYERLIVNGTLLPKGHGRLIDADEIQFENAEFDTYGDYCIAFDAIDQAEPIIEADKEQEDGKNDI